MDYKDFDEASQSRWNRAMYDDIIDTFLKRYENNFGEIVLNRDMKILDLGCGPGGLSLALLRRKYIKDIYLLDIRESGLKTAKKRINKEHPKTKVNLFMEDVHKMTFKSEYFDLIISRGSIQFWEHQRKALREIRRILKPEGVIYMGGGRGSIEFQERRLLEDKDWYPENFNMDPKEKKEFPSNRLNDSEYKALFDEYGDSYKFYDHLGDGHWIIWKKRRNGQNKS